MEGPINSLCPKTTTMTMIMMRKIQMRMMIMRIITMLMMMITHSATQRSSLVPTGENFLAAVESPFFFLMSFLPFDLTQSSVRPGKDYHVL